MCIPSPHPPDSATGWRRAHLLHDVDMHRKAKAWKLHQRLKQRPLKRQASGPTNGKVWGGTVALQDDLPPYDREHEYDPPQLHCPESTHSHFVAGEALHIPGTPRR